jgi:hypothetical protein
VPCNPLFASTCTYRLCSMSIYRMLKRVISQGWSRASKAIFAIARSVSKIWSDSRYRLNLVRWLPGLVGSEGECES